MKQPAHLLNNPPASTLYYNSKHRDYLANIFHTDYHQGLSQLEATHRLKQYGNNSITTSSINTLKIFIRQFQSAFIYLLLVAIILTLVLGETMDALMIIIFLVINVALGFYQEYSSEKTARFFKNTPAI